MRITACEESCSFPAWRCWPPIPLHRFRATISVGAISTAPFLIGLVLYGRLINERHPLHWFWRSMALVTIVTCWPGPGKNILVAFLGGAFGLVVVWFVANHLRRASFTDHRWRQSHRHIRTFHRSGRSHQPSAKSYRQHRAAIRRSRPADREGLGRLGVRAAGLSGGMVHESRLRVPAAFRPPLSIRPSRGGSQRRIISAVARAIRQRPRIPNVSDQTSAAQRRRGTYQQSSNGPHQLSPREQMAALTIGPRNTRSWPSPTSSRSCTRTITP